MTTDLAMDLTSSQLSDRFEKLFEIDSSKNVESLQLGYLRQGITAALAAKTFEACAGCLERTMRSVIGYEDFEDRTVTECRHVLSLVKFPPLSLESSDHAELDDAIQSSKNEDKLTNLFRTFPTHGKGIIEAAD